MREFIRNMTVWNWLAVIAFFLAVLGGFNAILSLKSRYRDWRGTKSKKEFEKRRSELASQLILLEIYKRDPTQFFLLFLHKATLVASSFLLGFLCFVAGTLTTSITSIFFNAFALLFSFNAIRLAFKTWMLTWRMNYPALWAVTVIDFLKNARDKGLESAESKQLLTSLLQNDIFTPTEKNIVSAHISRQYPSILSTILQGDSAK